MDYTNYTTDSKKHKHLNLQEQTIIEPRLKDGYSAYKIAKELHRPINTVLNEIRRGTVPQIKNKRRIELYLADAGQAIYEDHRTNCGRKSRRLVCNEFISYACDKLRKDKWSIDACVGRGIESGQFKRSEIICTKTFYNYIDQGLCDIKNIDLPLKMRRNTKKQRVRANKKRLGTSIEKRPVFIDSREEFGDRFSRVFKTITSDNGSEFANLSDLEQVTDTSIYFTHPYSSFERGTNERHNGLIRRFLPKGTRITDCSIDTIAFIEDWCNTLPRKILGYRMPEELFESEMDKIYAA